MPPTIFLGAYLHSSISWIYHDPHINRQGAFSNSPFVLHCLKPRVLIAHAQELGMTTTVIPYRTSNAATNCISIIRVINPDIYKRVNILKRTHGPVCLQYSWPKNSLVSIIRPIWLSQTLRSQRDSAPSRRGQKEQSLRCYGVHDNSTMFQIPRVPWFQVLQHLMDKN